jgi:hypothetical protein
MYSKLAWAMACIGVGAIVVIHSEWALMRAGAHQMVAATISTLEMTDFMFAGVLAKLFTTSWSAVCGTLWRSPLSCVVVGSGGGTIQHWPYLFVR